MNKKKWIIVSVSALILVAAAIATARDAAQNKSVESPSGSPAAVSQQPSSAASSEGSTTKASAAPSAQTSSNPQPETKNTKPTFMYFISSKDERFDETNKILDALKKEYSGKVNFDIRNIDDNPDLAAQFSISQTPTLYMLSSTGDFKDIKLGFSTQQQLEESIQKALS